MLVLPFLTQDASRVKDLIQNLDDDSFEVRDGAEKALIALGAVAIPQLRAVIADAEGQNEKAELRIRATSALRGIEFAEKAKLFYAEPRRITIHSQDAELGSVLSDLEKQSGARMNAGLINLKTKVTLNAENAPLFKVLDDLCRGQGERSYEYRDDEVRFSRTHFILCPSAYEGPFRFRLVKLRHERSTDYKTIEGQVQLALEADWQRYLKPSKRVDLDISRATDDKGTTLEAFKAGSDDPGEVLGIAANGRILMKQAGAQGGDDVQPSQMFTLRGLTTGATRISLRARARFSFPLEKMDVVFDKPAAAKDQEAGELSISLKNQGAARIWRLTLTHIQGRPAVNPEALDARIDRESFVAVDDSGKEYPAILHESSSQERQVFRRGAEVPEGSPLAVYQVVFPSLEDRPAKQIRFKFVSEIFVKTVPFALDDFSLP